MSITKATCRELHSLGKLHRSIHSFVRNPVYPLCLSGLLS